MTTPKKIRSFEKHELVPRHEKVSDVEKEKLLSELNISFKDLPKVYRSDAAIMDLDVKPGDVVKITRKSSTAKEIVFYRGISDA
jgi:DNA-directed RNA polymerase subunit H